MGDWIVSSFEVRVFPRGWEESAPVRVQPGTSSIYRRCWRRTERDLAQTRHEIQVQVWQSPIAATGWFDWFRWSWLAMMMHFYHFLHSRGGFVTVLFVCVWSYLADFSRCVSCRHNRKQINIQLQLLQQPREYLLSEEKQSLCCFCQTSSFQIRCSSGKWF